MVLDTLDRQFNFDSEALISWNTRENCENACVTYLRSAILYLFSIAFRHCPEATVELLCFPCSCNQPLLILLVQYLPS